MKITDLNADCLLQIFKFCSQRDLRNLCKTNKTFNIIINENIFYVQSLDLLLCGHRNDPIIQKRNHVPLSFKERLTITSNWLNGNYSERPYFHHAQMFPTKVCVDKDYLYMTYAAYLRKYRRGKIEPLQRRYELEISTSTKNDIADFVKKNNTIFSGRVNGSCYIYEDGIVGEQQMHNAKEYLYCVDFAEELFATSSDNCCKIWQREEEFGLVYFDLMKKFKSAFKTMKISSGRQLLIGGLYNDPFRSALRSIDIESGIISSLNSKTVSIYDLKLKDDNIIFTANFDTTFRIHDRRSNSDVAIWEDPFDSSFYCLEYDGLYAVLCGAKYHSRVNLYDIRVPGKYVQLYFPSRRTGTYTGSPVYSIACDSRFLFVATDHNLRVFDFKSKSCINRDYRNIFSEMHRF